jgi:hypothetical protein
MLGRMRTHSGRGAVLVVAVAAALMATSAAASPESAEAPAAVPAKTWTANFCGSIASWIAVVQRRTTAYNKAIETWKASGQGKIAAIRAVVVAYVRDTTAATDRMVAKVRAGGAPAVPKGATTQTLVMTALGRISGVFHTALTQARALPRSNAVRFITKTTALSKQIVAGFGKIGGAFAAIDKQSSTLLETAARATPACAKLG